MRTLSVQRYSPDLTPCRIDLSDNTNAWGMSPAARDAILTSQVSPRYPDAYASGLKAVVAEYLSVPESMVATGCGSDDVLDVTIRAFGRPGERLAFTAPTFVMIPAFASLNGMTPTATTFAGLATSGAAIVYVASPNNPTGAVVTPDAIRKLLERSADAVVIVDEAYAEFSGSTVVDLVSRYERLIVTRTMSKAFGLASLRVGYAIAQPELVAAIEASRGPYKVSAIGERAAVAALTAGRPWMIEHAALAVESRERLASELRRRGLEPLPSAANFLFVPMPDAVEVAAAMLERGVRVRAFADPAGLRVTVAPWPVMQAMLDALDEVRPCA